ncbi:6-carboxyhexanoate--CoA ligase [Bacillus fengqiuensis]|nr:6-carboxyhexanoate--CoA ligase [Bacillus fengqiuensis]
MPNELYSIRMRAAQGGAHERGGRHVSGGERIGQKADLHELVSEMLTKSLNHSRGDCDFIQVVVEKLQDVEIQTIKPLPVSTDDAQSVQEGRDTAAAHLSTLGVSDTAIKQGFILLEQSTNQRGAIILDGLTGERLDHRELKGVRVSRMDWDAKAWKQWTSSHESLGSPRIREALVLASKVSSSPYTMAELCWSDDPDYVTGYIANATIGYKRITPLKKAGSPCGGRIFFVKQNCPIEDYIAYLEETPVWIKMEKIAHS